MALALQKVLPALLAGVSLAMLILVVLMGERGGGVFAFLTVLFPILLIALGTAGSTRKKKRGPVGVLILLLVLALVLGSAMAALLLLQGRVMESPWILGLPLAVWVQLGGFWLVPLLLVGLGHAWTFDCQGLEEEDLRRLRRTRLTMGRGTASDAASQRSSGEPGS